MAKATDLRKRELKLQEKAIQAEKLKYTPKYSHKVLPSSMDKPHL